MNSSEVRKKYLDFFVKKGHKIVTSSSLVPENDPTTLFTGSGMQPMIQYLLGTDHPLGKRIVDSQKCFRSQDIEEIGDNRHDTLFEMLGNWSLGDYWKEDQLKWFFEFLTQELKLDHQKLYVSVFEGNDSIPKDEESTQIWKDLGIPEERIYYYGVEKNWWSRSGTPDQMPTGEPGGPDSEVFYLFDDIDHNPKFGDKCHPNCDCGRFVEIGNSVFMQYQKQTDGSFKELPQKNVDFGGGLERLLMAVNDQPDMFRNDLHWPLIEKVCQELSITYDQDPKITSNLRIIADHIKAATFLIKAGVIPSNKQQGYVLRRLIRRAAIKLHTIKEHSMEVLPKLVDPVIDIYQGTNYFKTPHRHLIEPDGLRTRRPERSSEGSQGDKAIIRQVVEEEVNKFKSTLVKGLKEIQKIETISGKIAFDLYQTYGFPLEITTEIFEEKGQKINKLEFEEEFKKHQDLSRTTSAGTFKGGLADSTEQTTKLHTANHLMQAALRIVLGEHVRQRGSNITAERLRFDFPHPQKLTEEEIKKVEDLVNEKIKEDLPVHFDIEDKDVAIKKGALTNYGENYPEKSKVYKIGTDGNYFSMELCGGPHVEHTGVIGAFKIIKQESLGAGLRRIYATVS